MDSWTGPQSALMLSGGNARLQRYFDQLQLLQLPPGKRYKTNGAAHYRSKLRLRAEGQQGGDTGVGSPTESSTEGPTERPTSSSGRSLSMASASDDGVPLPSMSIAAAGVLSSPAAKHAPSTSTGSGTVIFTARFAAGPLGFSLQPDTPTVGPGRTGQGCAVVSLVLPGQQAVAAGLQPRDTVHSVTGVRCTGYQQAAELIREAERPVQITFCRARQQQQWQAAEGEGDLTPNTAAQRAPGMVDSPVPDDDDDGSGINHNSSSSNSNSGARQWTGSAVAADAAADVTGATEVEVAAAGASSPATPTSATGASTGAGTRERTASGGFIVRPPQLNFSSLLPLPTGQHAAPDTANIAVCSSSTTGESAGGKAHTPRQARVRARTSSSGSSAGSSAGSSSGGLRGASTSLSAEKRTPRSSGCSAPLRGSASKGRARRRSSSSVDGDGGNGSTLGALARPKSPGAGVTYASLACGSGAMAGLSVFERLSADAEARAGRRSAGGTPVNSSSARSISGDSASSRDRGDGTMSPGTVSLAAALAAAVAEERAGSQPSRTNASAGAGAGRPTLSVPVPSEDGSSSAGLFSPIVSAADSSPKAVTTAATTLVPRPQLQRMASNNPVDFRVLFQQAPLGVTLTRSPASAGATGTAQVTRLTPGGHALQMGVAVGDVIVGLDNLWLGSYNEVMEVLPQRTFPYALVFRRTTQQAR